MTTTTTTHPAALSFTGGKVRHLGNNSRNPSIDLTQTESLAACSLAPQDCMLALAEVLARAGTDDPEYRGVVVKLLVTFGPATAFEEEDEEDDGEGKEGDGDAQVGWAHLVCAGFD
jgi:hypothetical protein